MTKRIVNKAERNAERYDAKEVGYQLYEDSRNQKMFKRLMPFVVSEQNILLAYRNICKNGGSKTPGTDGKTIVQIQELSIEEVIKTVRNKLNYYQPKKVRRVEIPKDNGKTRPLGIQSIWDRNFMNETMVSDPIAPHRMPLPNAIRWHRYKIYILLWMWISLDFLTTLTTISSSDSCGELEYRTES